jgi:5-formyltetrahydrofolate cyclo-ligase
LDAEKIQTEKANIRTAVLAERDLLDSDFCVDASLRLSGHFGQIRDLIENRIVSSYFPIRSELDPTALMELVLGANTMLALPAVIDDTTIVFRMLAPGVPLEPGKFGTFHPPESAEELDPDVMFVPLSAFDRTGGRMGYGAGHYDRVIERMEDGGLKPLLIGVGFGMQEVSHVPREPHDRRLDIILTENDLIDCRSLAAGSA